jgi:DNA-directed RNA polymerase subunit beta'
MLGKKGNLQQSFKRNIFRTKSFDFDAIKISIASDKDILKWSYGEVTKPETINYRTQKPERDGLFDERIFGPTRDYECYCGKYKKIRYKGVVCDKCGVEVTRSAVRRERMGHITLSVPVAHIWYVRGVPSRIGLMLDMSPRDLEKVIYFASFVVLEIDEALRKKALNKLEKEFQEYKSGVNNESAERKTEKDKNSASQKLTARDLDRIKIAYQAAKAEIESLSSRQVVSESKYLELSMKYGQIIKVGIGAEAIYNLLSQIDLDDLVHDLENELKQFSQSQSPKKILKRLKIVSEFKENNLRPEWMVLKSLPVIPPDLRPMVQLDGGRFAASDLNDLYRRVINRNNRLKRLISQGAPEVICRNEKRMLQEAVDALIDNSARREKAVTASANRRKLKSLSDMLRGKQGRFRQNLLGKRVDYSGRSVIVVGPDLKLDECGLPKVMALELFKPFVISKLISNGFAHNVKNATRMIERGEAQVWDILEELTEKHYVLLNRAPTLHRLGIQAFKPVLIEGKAIQIHPLVCEAYNADFDGDQMAVYIPLSIKAQEEAAEMMSADKNLLKPASGEPIVSPQADMILGCYYLTSFNDKSIGSGKYFSSSDEAIIAHRNGAVGIQAKIKVKIDEEIIETSVGRILFNQILPGKMPFKNLVLNKKGIRLVVAEVFARFGTKITAKVVDKVKDIGFYYACHSGITFATEDIEIPQKKKEIIAQAEKNLNNIEKQYSQGLITDQERYIQIVNLWARVKGEIEKAMLDNFSRHNPIFEMVTSGSRGSIAQLTQVAGMKGLVASPSGEIIELPIKANYKEGLSAFEYFISTHGARKGRSDTALRTADAGYLTRRLIDVAQDVVISGEDCGTKEGITIFKQEFENDLERFEAAISGRIAVEDISDPKTKKKIVKANEEISNIAAKAITESNLEELKIFSALACKSIFGVCQKCYGRDLATGQKASLGTAVGIIAAQAIGEPGTQLTMRTFHIGGIAGVDITQGLPRVEELFEARTPKVPAIVAEIDGKISISTVKDRKVITITSKEKRVEEYQTSKDYKMLVKNNQFVKNKQAIATAPGRRSLRAAFEGRVVFEKGKISLTSVEPIVREYLVNPQIAVYVASGDEVKKGTQLTEGHWNLEQMMKLIGSELVQKYIIKQVQDIYASQGQTINDKHVELIIKQMFSRVRILNPEDSDFLPGQIVSRIEEKNKDRKKKGKKPITFEDLILGISRVALSTDSFLSAASFQETTNVLIEAATSGKIDHLRGLKENVIIGKLIPAGTGFKGKLTKVDKS